MHLMALAEEPESSPWPPPGPQPPPPPPGAPATAATRTATRTSQQTVCVSAGIDVGGIGRACGCGCDDRACAICIADNQSGIDLDAFRSVARSIDFDGATKQGKVRGLNTFRVQSSDFHFHCSTRNGHQSANVHIIHVGASRLNAESTLLYQKFPSTEMALALLEEMTLSVPPFWLVAVALTPLASELVTVMLMVPSVCVRICSARMP